MLFLALEILLVWSPYGRVLLVDDFVENNVNKNMNYFVYLFFSFRVWISHFNVLISKVMK